MKIVFITDPLQGFDPISETTSFIIHECQKRKWDVYNVELKDLHTLKNSPHAKAKKLEIKKSKAGFKYKILRHQTLDLNKVDAIFLRKDPPVNIQFIDHLSILELIDKNVLLINNPTSIKAANEKIFALKFSQYCTDTLVSACCATLQEFIDKYPKTILKPLNFSGGKGIVLIERNHPSVSSILDVLTEQETQFIMAQKYLKEAKQGDKRILLLDGEILGSFLRVPGQKDFRGNLHSGAKMKKSKVTNYEREMIKEIKPVLKEMGLYFVGLDLIGDKITEINVTSPMGINEINRLYEKTIEKDICDWLDKKLKK